MGEEETLGAEEKEKSTVPRPTTTFEEYMESMKGVDDCLREMRIEDDEANPQIEVG